MRVADAGLGEAVAQPHGHLRTGCLGGEARLEPIEAAHLVVRVEVRVVGDVVGRPGESVEAHDVGAQPPGDQPRGDGEVLVARPLARRRLDIFVQASRRFLGHRPFPFRDDIPARPRRDNRHAGLPVVRRAA